MSVCPAATYDYAPHAKVNVNVYNSTSRPGLARTVADEFAARKFVVGTVGNTDVELPRRGAGGLRCRRPVGRLQRPAQRARARTMSRTAARTPSVDVILTGDYKELAKPELVDQTPGKLSCPRENRRIVDDATLPVVPTATPGTG